MSSFRFRKKTDYGLTMVSLLAQKGQGGLVSVRSMQERGLPRSFLVKIARDLIKAGIAGAKEGRNGGYYLAQAPEKISLHDVVRAIEGEVRTTDCSIHGIMCPMADRCPHRKVMNQLTVEITAVLEKYHLSDFEKVK